MQFAGDYKVSALNGQTWMGGRIITDKGTHVLWQVNGGPVITRIKLAKAP